MASNSSSDYSDYDDSDNFEISDQDSFNLIPCSIPLNFALYMNPAKMSEVKINESFLATVTSRKTTQLVKVIPCQECSPESVLVPKLLQRTLDAAVGDKVAITGYDTKAKADAIQVVPLFDTEGIDYTNDLKEYFSIESHPISISATFSLLINGAIRIFRIVNIIQIDRCCTTSATRIVLIDPKDLQAPHMAVLSRHFCDLALPSEIHNHINKYIFLPLQHQRLLRSLGVRSANGVIFYGVAGTGKTSLLIAISREAHVQSLTITAPELFTMPIDQAFSKLQQGFRYVLDHTPAMLLIDDIGILAGKTDNNTPLNVRRLRSYFISLLDRSMGIPGFVIVATANDKNEIDPSLIRFGRFGFEATLELPPSPQRAEILKLNTQGISIDQDDIIKLAGKTLEGKSCANVESVAEIGVCNMIRKSIVENRTYPLDDEIIKACTGHLNLEDFPVNVVDNGGSDGFGNTSGSPGSNEGLSSNQGYLDMMGGGSGNANVDLGGTSFGSGGGVPKINESDDFFDTLSSSIPKQPGTSSGMPELDASMFLGQASPQEVQNVPKSDGGSASVSVGDNNANGSTDMFGRPIQQSANNDVDMFGRSSTTAQSNNSNQPDEMFSGFGNPSDSVNNNSADIINNDNQQDQQNQPQPQQNQQPQQPQPIQQQNDDSLSQQQQQQSDPFANFGSSDISANPFATDHSLQQQPQASSQPQVPQQSSEPQNQSDPFANFGSTEISANPFASDNSASVTNNDPFDGFNASGGFGVPPPNQQQQQQQGNLFGQQQQDQQNQPFGQLPQQSGSQPTSVPPSDAFSSFGNQNENQQQFGQQLPPQSGSQPTNSFPGFQQQDQIPLGQQTQNQEVADPFGSFGSNGNSPQQSNNSFGGSPQNQQPQNPFGGPPQDQQNSNPNPFGSQPLPSQNPFNSPQQDQQQPPQNPFASQQDQQQQPQNPFASQQDQQQPPQNPFASQQDQQQPPQNPFASQQQQKPQNPFSSQQDQQQLQNPFSSPSQQDQQNQSPFGGPQQQQQQQDPFGSQPQQSNSFGGGIPQQQQDPFGSQQQQNQSPFGGSQQQQQDPFGSQPQQPNSFGGGIPQQQQNSFGGPSQQQQDPFGGPQQPNSFGGGAPQQNQFGGFGDQSNGLQQNPQDPFGGPPNSFGGFNNSQMNQGGFGMQQQPYQPPVILGGGGIHDMFYNNTTQLPQQESQPVMQEPIEPLYKPNVPDSGKNTEIIDIFGEGARAKKQQQQQQQQQQQNQQQNQQTGSYGGPGMYNNGPGNNNFMNNGNMNNGGFGQNYGGMGNNNQFGGPGGQFNNPMNSGGQYNSGMNTGGFSGGGNYGSGGMMPGNNQFGGMGNINQFGMGNNQFGGMGNNQYGGMNNNNYAAGGFGGMPPSNNKKNDDIFARYDPLNKK